VDVFLVNSIVPKTGGHVLIAKFGSLVWMIGQINLQVCDLIVD
jgi:hypothetical protein